MWLELPPGNGICWLGFCFVRYIVCRRMACITFHNNPPLLFSTSLPYSFTLILCNSISHYLDFADVQCCLSHFQIYLLTTIYVSSVYNVSFLVNVRSDIRNVLPFSMVVFTYFFFSVSDLYFRVGIRTLFLKGNKWLSNYRDRVDSVLPNKFRLLY